MKTNRLTARISKGPYPDEDAIDMLCPGSLYPRVFTEGMFGIVPTGLDSFECTPWLPKAWPRMALRDLRAFGQSWDLVVERVGDQQKVTVLSGGKTLMTGSGLAGKTYALRFPVLRGFPGDFSLGPGLGLRGEVEGRLNKSPKTYSQARGPGAASEARTPRAAPPRLPLPALGHQAGGMAAGAGSERALGPEPGQARGMQDLQLYQQLLGLSEPWSVTGVRLDVKAQEVEVTVAVGEQLWGCPQCACRMHVHAWETRRWRHLDSCQFKTLIRADVPVVKCPEHGSQTVAVPWAEKYGRFSKLFERLAIDVMRECSVSAVCGLLRISWDEADGIKQRAVARGLRRKQAQPVTRLGVDEKSAGRGQNYVTVVANLAPSQAATVEYVGEGRKQEALDGYWQQVPAPQRAAVEAVAMDLWEPYFNSTLAHVPEAAQKIVHDPYHLGRMLSEAVDKVRKGEHRVLMETGDDRLAGTKYVWLYGWENLPAVHRERFDDLRGQRLKTSRAWAIKELFRDFWTSETVAEGREFFRRWYSWAIRSRLAPIKRVAKSFKDHLANTLTYFTHRITNAALEGLNNRIAGLVKKAFGYRNRERFKTDILFHLGNLDLYPSQ